MAAILDTGRRWRTEFWKGTDHPRIISAKFGWDWRSSFRGEDFFLFHPPFFQITILGQNLQKFKVHKKSRNICQKAHHYSSTVQIWALSGLKQSSFGHLKKVLFLVMAAIFDIGRRWRTPFWKGSTQGSFQQSLVEIGAVVSEEKICFKIIPLFSNLNDRSKKFKVHKKSRNTC